MQKNISNKKPKYKNGIRIIAKYLKDYKKDFVTLSVLSVISAVINGFIPFVAGRLFDAITDYDVFFDGSKIEMPSWLFFIVLWGAIKLTGDIVDWKSGIKDNCLREFVFADYIAKNYSKIIEFPMSFHKSKKMGEITDRINKAANSMVSITSDIIIQLTPQFLSIFIALGLSFYINYQLGIIMLAGIIFYSYVLIKETGPLSELHRKGHKSYSEAFGGAYEAVFNAQPIKQAATEDYEKKKISSKFKISSFGFWQKIYKIWQKLTFYQRLTVTLVQLVVFVYSIILINGGNMTIGELVMFNGYAAMVFGPFAILGRNWQIIQNGIVALERSEEVLQTPAENYEPENAIELEDIKGDIEFKNVYFSYKAGKPVLENINFKVRQGEVVALVGESGVGKSTLIDLISAYYFPNKGKVLIDGHDVRKIKLKFLRSMIGVVPQETVLFNDTIKTNVKYGSFKASDEEINEAAERAHALDFIEKFPKKWKQIVGERGVKLSVGQKQRVSIARAILRDPRILILDEPTSALDANSESIIQKSLEELMQGRTTFIIAHRLSTVRKANKIFVFEGGKIAEEGTHEELIKKEGGIYRKLYELQIGLHE